MLREGGSDHPSMQLVDGELRRWLWSPSLLHADLGVSPVEEAAYLPGCSSYGCRCGSQSLFHPGVGCLVAN